MSLAKMLSSKAAELKANPNAAPLKQSDAIVAADAVLDKLAASLPALIEVPEVA